ncbi:hypothetical protein CC1G_11139 [Coprinopsis cinerea okayama7|uniref:Uncharacterized protein n=1 Tax=Coprinopsis cinerea (strain Okayama-7 / 130 / ATCC MYA-4618 / FGSC 9003) TaxID=240176 RepID=A8N4S7_COPC7|nr:hypothetical protein CC1G_11139 [Coprinopsis cinerea okayama7\|eukprot:XP_001829869.2 hypothetical protein CC1G_11139 [Coprinopsis cinerea okayama7\
MENIYDEGNPNDLKRPTLGNIDLGTRKFYTVKGQDGKLIRRTDLLVRPKVVLAHTLEELVPTVPLVPANCKL